MFKLPNGKYIDQDMLEAAMEDGTLEHSYSIPIQWAQKYAA